ncbi:hypothetical protein UPYG_G00219680 [Umbra pygmaea]|uniref:Calnexin-like n=1 Tax=Umbra pygmaea TaxID=75934 RepID=A0ABD0WLH3_UMBPY
MRVAVMMGIRSEINYSTDMRLIHQLISCLWFTTACSVQSSYSLFQIAEEAHFAENFDSAPLDRRWVLSREVKQTDTGALKYDGQWKLEEPEAILQPGNRVLVMKSSGKHHAIAAYLNRPFTFQHKHTLLCLQYEVRFGKGVECSGAYVKLLTQTDRLRLSQFSEDTPYSVMFGPDKCGTNHRLHLIVRVTNPSDGRYQEMHAAQPTDDLRPYFTDRQPHLYTLNLYADSKYEIFIDKSLVSQGHLLTDEATPTESPESQQKSLLTRLGEESVEALGLELWSLSGEVMFDNFLVTDDLKMAESWTQDSWGQKQPGRMERLLIATNSRPWLWGVYVFTVGLPLILFVSFMWPDKRFGPPDQDYYYKKSDDPQPDSQSETDRLDGQSERKEPDRPSSLANYGVMSRGQARRRETQRKSDLEIKNEGHSQSSLRSNRL